MFLSSTVRRNRGTEWLKAVVRSLVRIHPGARKSRVRGYSCAASRLPCPRPSTSLERRGDLRLSVGADRHPERQPRRYPGLRGPTRRPNLASAYFRFLLGFYRGRSWAEPGYRQRSTSPTPRRTRRRRLRGGRCHGSTWSHGGYSTPAMLLPVVVSLRSQPRRTSSRPT